MCSEMKWIPLALIAIGIVAIIFAIRAGRTSSFDDGTFIMQIIVGLCGAAGIVIGGVWLAVLFFINL